MTETIRRPQNAHHLEQLERLARGDAPAPPIATLVGLRAVRFELGRAVMEMTAGPQHANPMGTLHGGVICDLADAAMGCAMATTLEADESFTTVDLNAKFFRPVWNARLEAEARVVKRTRSLGHVECDVVDEEGHVVAKTYSTCMVLRGEAASGR
jgi:uncharacterized protein (TIGR00369 family)